MAQIHLYLPGPRAGDFPSVGSHERIRSPLPMRIRVSDPRLLRDRCDFLSRRGCVAVEVGEDAAEILIPGAGSSFEAVAMLMSEIGIWRAKQESVQVVVEPEG